MRLVVISGMHRSGTSLVARVVNLLGVDLGNVAEMLETRPDNRTGFWENGSVTLFNDDLLSFLGGRWDDPPVLADGWETAEALDPWRERAGDIITKLFPSSECAGWKDPRMSLLFPFWRTVAAFDPGVVSIRDPAEVAASLNERQRIDPETAAHLWLRYVTGALRADDGAHVVSYASFSNDLEATAVGLAEHLRLPAPGSDTLATITAFFDAGLQHHARAPVSKGPQMQLARLAYDVIEAGKGEPLVALLDRLWQTELSASEVAALRDQNQAIVSQQESLVSQRDVAIRQRDELNEHRDELIGERDIAIRQRDELNEHRDELIGEREIAIRQRDELGDRAALTEERNQIQYERLASLENTTEVLRTDMVALEAALEAHTRQLAEKQSRIEDLERSLFRRLTARIGGTKS